MVRKLAVVIGLAMSLVVAQEASAIPIPVPITETNLDTWTGDRFLLGSHTAQFTNPFPPFVMGELSSTVFFDGVQDYTYVLRVTPSFYVDFRAVFTEFGGDFGFTGVIGWSFSDASNAGLFEGEGGFAVGQDAFTGRLGWNPHPHSFWNPFEPISLFYVSTLPPKAQGTYMMSGFAMRPRLGSAEGFAPIPEPGSIALLGSGLVGLYAAVRRRRSQKGERSSQRSAMQ